MDDLFAVPKTEDDARLVGSIRGSLEGIGAGLEAWCGPAIGWRPFGEIVLGGGAALVVRHRGRLAIGLTFDLGPAPTIVAADSIDGAADA
jgi:hypothetical protein